MDADVNHLLHITGASPARRVAKGQLDLFAVNDALPEQLRRLHHLCTLTEGQSIAGIEPLIEGDAVWSCAARPARGARLERLDGAPGDAYGRAEFSDQVREIQDKLAHESKVLGKKRAYSEARLRAAVDRLTDVNKRLARFETHDYDGQDELLAACEVVGRYLGVSIEAPTSDVVDKSLRPVEAILHLSRVRYREVTLTGKWWRRNSVPMLGQMDDGTPVALLPRGLNGYSVYNARTGNTQKLTENLAARILPEAHAVYRTLPQGKLTALSMARFLLGSHIYVELSVIALFTMLASMIQVLPPILSAQIFGTIVPGHQRAMLIEVILILVAFQVAQVGFNIVMNLGFSRIKTKIDLALQAGVWDRLLGQRLQFFYQYATGELLEKIKGLQTINTTLSLDLLKTASATLFSFVNLYVMYRYSPTVTHRLIWPFLILFAVLIFLSYRKQRLTKRFIRIQNDASAFDHQMVSGIQRIKVSYAEDRAFQQWCRLEAERRDVEGHIALMTTLADAFKTFFTLASVAYVYLLIAREMDVDVGVFVAYTATFMIFQAAMVQLAGILDKVLVLWPVIQNVEPLLTAVPDDPTRRTTPKDIDGSMELSHVSFNYDKYGRTVLHDISLRIEPGQSVGIVGLSGCGKTTLMKLMLGLYQPVGGQIYFGGYDLSTVDTQFLRRQLGVVMQSGELSYGSIYQNIAQGDIAVTEQAARDALAAVNLLQDIDALPHGLYTQLDAEHIQLSDGQIQRLLIARAIAKQRPYVFFDEATSRIDNALTSRIMRHIIAMKGTKIVVAQRLATIEDCDRVIVMEDGKIIADGSYDEVINQKKMYGVLFDQEDEDPYDETA